MVGQTLERLRKLALPPQKDVSPSRGGRLKRALGPLILTVFLAACGTREGGNTPTATAVPPTPDTAPTAPVNPAPTEQTSPVEGTVFSEPIGADFGGAFSPPEAGFSGTPEAGPKMQELTNELMRLSNQMIEYMRKALPDGNFKPIISVQTGEYADGRNALLSVTAVDARGFQHLTVFAFVFVDLDENNQVVNFVVPQFAGNTEEVRGTDLQAEAEAKLRPLLAELQVDGEIIVGMDNRNGNRLVAGVLVEGGQDSFTVFKEGQPNPEFRSGRFMLVYDYESGEWEQVVPEGNELGNNVEIKRAEPTNLLFTHGEKYEEPIMKAEKGVVREISRSDSAYVVGNVDASSIRFEVDIPFSPDAPRTGTVFVDIVIPDLNNQRVRVAVDVSIPGRSQFISTQDVYPVQEDGPNGEKQFRTSPGFPLRMHPRDEIIDYLREHDGMPIGVLVDFTWTGDASDWFLNAGLSGGNTRFGETRQTVSWLLYPDANPKPAILGVWSNGLIIPGK